MAMANKSLLQSDRLHASLPYCLSLLTLDTGDIFLGSLSRIFIRGRNDENGLSGLLKSRSYFNIRYSLFDILRFAKAFLGQTQKRSIKSCTRRSSGRWYRGQSCQEPSSYRQFYWWLVIPVLSFPSGYNPPYFIVNQDCTPSERFPGTPSAKAKQYYLGVIVTSQ